MSIAASATLGEIADAVARNVHDNSTTRRVSIKEAINSRLETVGSMMEWPQLVTADTSGLRRLGDTETSIIAGDSHVPMPLGGGKLRSLTYIDNADGHIRILPPADFFARVSGRLAQQGVPQIATLVGTTVQFVKLDADASVTVFNPNSSSNDNARSVIVEYQTSSSPAGHYVADTVQGSFSSGTGVALQQEVAAGYSISKLVIPVNWVGGIRLLSGGATYVDVPSPSALVTASNTKSCTVANELYRLWPVPSANHGLVIARWRPPRKLADEDQSPEIPVATYLLEGATADILRQLNKGGLAAQHDAVAAAFVKMHINQHHETETGGHPLAPNILWGCGMY